MTLTEDSKTASRVVGETSGKHALKIHLGRQVLGLPLDGVDRRQWIRPEEKVPDGEFVVAYERLLVACENDPKKRLQNFERWHGDHLLRHFARYVEVRAKMRGESAAEVTVETYRRFLAMGELLSDELGTKPFEPFTPIGRHFDAYIDALADLGRVAEAEPLVEKLAPLWEHNLGYGMVGRAAWKMGNHVLAESRLLKLHEGFDGWHRSDKVGILAEIWMAKGERDRARKLLVDCMARMEKEDPEKIVGYTGIVERLRADFARLFPGETGR